MTSSDAETDSKPITFIIILLFMGGHYGYYLAVSSGGVGAAVERRPPRGVVGERARAGRLAERGGRLDRLAVHLHLADDEVGDRRKVVLLRASEQHHRRVVHV